jgi:2-keto-4-pentenoate hydratase/2-oxohepta-3-ene-1,7-dioic acid hydratase in catechol pathway
MRLARSRTAAGVVVPVAARGDGWFDLSPLTGAVGPEALSAAALSGVRTAIDAGEVLGTAEPRWYAPPPGRIGKIVCIGLTYGDHAAETGRLRPRSRSCS